MSALKYVCSQVHWLQHCLFSVQDTVGLHCAADQQQHWQFLSKVCSLVTLHK
jgi:hypothetical protein